MRVEICRDGPCGGLNAYRWLEKNVGRKNHGWTLKSEVLESPGRTIHRIYIEIDNELDAMAYKLRFDTSYKRQK